MRNGLLKLVTQTLLSMYFVLMLGGDLKRKIL